MTSRRPVAEGGECDRISVRKCCAKTSPRRSALGIQIHRRGAEKRRGRRERQKRKGSTNEHEGHEQKGSACCFLRILCALRTLLFLFSAFSALLGASAVNARR